MNKTFEIGRIGSQLSSNVSRRGASVEDQQFLVNEAKEAHPVVFGFLDTHAKGEYTTGFTGSFTMAKQAAFNVFVNFTYDVTVERIIKEAKKDGRPELTIFC